jgi:hypothetical protein
MVEKLVWGSSEVKIYVSKGTNYAYNLKKKPIKPAYIILECSLICNHP